MKQDARKALLSVFKWGGISIIVATVFYQVMPKYFYTNQGETRCNRITGEVQQATRKDNKTGKYLFEKRKIRSYSDYEKAKNEGCSDDEIYELLKQEHPECDFEEARKMGFSKETINKFCAHRLDQLSQDYDYDDFDDRSGLNIH